MVEARLYSRSVFLAFALIAVTATVGQAQTPGRNAARASARQGRPGPGDVCARRRPDRRNEGRRPERPPHRLHLHRRTQDQGAGVGRSHGRNRGRLDQRRLRQPDPPPHRVAVAQRPRRAVVRRRGSGRGRADGDQLRSPRAVRYEAARAESRVLRARARRRAAAQQLVAVAVVGHRERPRATSPSSPTELPGSFTPPTAAVSARSAAGRSPTASAARRCRPARRPFPIASSPNCAWRRRAAAARPSR